MQQSVQVGPGLGAHRLAQPVVELGLVEPAVPVVLGEAVRHLGPVGIGHPHGGVSGMRAAVRVVSPPA